MIVSHDSFTFAKPKNILMNLFTIWWRCQKLDIQEQYDLGVRVFDIRVYRHKNQWGVSHGVAKFAIYFNSIETIFKTFKYKFPGSIIRVILEDNANKNPDIFKQFMDEADECYDKYKDILWCIGTHHPWKIYLWGPYKYNLKEYYCHLFRWDPDLSFWHNITHIDWSSWSLKHHAKKHNPEITQDMIDDKETWHVMDYIGIYPKNKIIHLS